MLPRPPPRDTKNSFKKSALGKTIFEKIVCRGKRANCYGTTVARSVVKCGAKIAFERFSALSNKLPAAEGTDDRQEHAQRAPDDSHNHPGFCLTCRSKVRNTNLMERSFLH
ncbi:hypothetical protein NPIL_291631 [Nephila pilipes]|uniref:Uncharacterized protein n=1 Tax=Nephila pilipes TaxID=299642 RepID=A0A8X6MVZ1_NEPPI|nr:hypothetical protein NPIL_291631 [Nephila pilipes]